MNKRGITLIFSFLVIVILSIIGAAMISRSLSEHRLAQRSLESTQAFWLAEAAVNQSLKLLRANYNTSILADTALGEGGYSAVIAANADGTRTVQALGFIPFSAPYRVERRLEVNMNKVALIPNNFYENAIYSALDIVLKGTSYDVTGDVRYANNVLGDTSNITGNKVQDSSIKPLAFLDFEQLRAISIAQGNYHDVSSLGGPFPAAFWYDEAAGVPNVIFIEGSLEIKGNDKVGGFFVVGGEVTYDADISGNVSVAGCIYSRGNFTIKGGGNSLNIDGGVWTGGTSTLDGNAKIAYNAAYMNAIKALNINTRVQVILWKDQQNPYYLSP